MPISLCSNMYYSTEFTHQVLKLHFLSLSDYHPTFWNDTPLGFWQLLHVKSWLVQILNIKKAVCVENYREPYTAVQHKGHRNRHQPGGIYWLLKGKFFFFACVNWLLARYSAMKCFFHFLIASPHHWLCNQILITSCSIVYNSHANIALDITLHIFPKNAL